MAEHDCHAFIQKHVPIASRPEKAIQPANVLDLLDAGLTRNQRPEDFQPRSQPAERHPHLMDAFDLAVQHRRQICIGVAQASIDHCDEGFFAGRFRSETQGTGFDVSDGFGAHEGQ